MPVNQTSLCDIQWHPVTFSDIQLLQENISMIMLIILCAKSLSPRSWVKGGQLLQTAEAFHWITFGWQPDALCACVAGSTGNEESGRLPIGLDVLPCWALRGHVKAVLNAALLTDCLFHKQTTSTHWCCIKTHMSVAMNRFLCRNSRNFFIFSPQVRYRYDTATSWSYEPKKSSIRLLAVCSLSMHAL